MKRRVTGFGDAGSSKLGMLRRVGLLLIAYWLFSLIEPMHGMVEHKRRRGSHVEFRRAAWNGGLALESDLVALIWIVVVAYQRYVNTTKDEDKYSRWRTRRVLRMPVQLIENLSSMLSLRHHRVSLGIEDLSSMLSLRHHRVSLGIEDLSSMLSLRHHRVSLGIEDLSSMLSLRHHRTLNRYNSCSFLYSCLLFSSPGLATLWL